eukprot:TRINITY_DN1759_c0_g3_i2.p1 TRINITY_DN1759_c0_g3~~TRINITY_DN1759_c0_g3_i2.p1  ORF type:complete len:139 (+),score=33.82 TRINITY_DN1759_c0_g3_i2:155-571(+)
MSQRPSKQANNLKEKTQNLETEEETSPLKALFKKVQTPKSQWTPTELSDAIHWMRQVIGIICGLIWGLIPITGFIGNFLFIGVNYTVVYLWYEKYQDIDEEEYGGRYDLFKEGLPSSIALFLISWIVSYNFRLEYLSF